MSLSFHLFIACLNPNIGLSSLPPSQSSVDHKEFKRCGPFDPYINAKVCTQRCWKPVFEVAPLLSCCVGLLCLGLFCCCCCCCLRGHCCRDTRKLLISPVIIQSRSSSGFLLMFTGEVHLYWDVFFSKNDDSALLHALHLQRGSFHI